MGIYKSLQPSRFPGKSSISYVFAFRKLVVDFDPPLRGSPSAYRFPPKTRKAGGITEGSGSITGVMGVLLSIRFRILGKPQ